MIALVFGAVRARTAQALTVLILTALIAAVAVAGPWYALAAASRAADGDVAAAPAAQRTLSIRKVASTSGMPGPALDAFAGTVRSILPIPDPNPVVGMTVALTVEGGDTDPAMSVSYRAGFCEHVRLTGTCPAGSHEAAVSQDVAEQLGLAVGDSLELRASRNADPVRLRVVASYLLLDPAGSYWSNKLFRANGGLEPAFTSLDTFTDDQLTGPTITYDVGVPAALIRGDDGYRLAEVLRRADVDFTAVDLRLVNPTGTLLRTIERDRRTIREGVVVALCQVLVLGLFAIGLAGRYTGRERRGDAALLKLRGSTRGGLLWLALGQHLVPMLAGVLVGAPLGFLVVRLLAGPVRGPADRLLGLELTAAAVAATLLGGLLVLAVVEAAVLRLPVWQLLSRVSSGRRDWRADVIDLVLLAVALGATYQVRAGRTAGGLALVAPALVALAVALLLARLLGHFADRGGGAALRAGRLRLGLTAAQASRRPGIDRVFALVAVAVAIFVGTAGVWSAGREARTQRSEVELGAPRVLTVQASNRTALQWAVRHADPGGKQAMAAVVDSNSLPPVVAVDSARLAAVTRWRPEYGALSIPTSPPAAPMVTGGGLRLRVSNDDNAPIMVTAVLQHEATGTSHTVAFGPLRPGEHTVRATVDGCTAAPGCRLVRWQLSSPPGGPPSTTAAVTLRGLTQEDPPGVVLDEAALGDPRRCAPTSAARASTSSPRRESSPCSWTATRRARRSAAPGCTPWTRPCRCPSCWPAPRRRTGSSATRPSTPSAGCRRGSGWPGQPRCCPWSAVPAYSWIWTRPGASPPTVSSAASSRSGSPRTLRHPCRRPCAHRDSPSSATIRWPSGQPVSVRRAPPSAPRSRCWRRRSACCSPQPPSPSRRPSNEISKRTNCSRCACRACRSERPSASGTRAARP